MKISQDFADGLQGTININLSKEELSDKFKAELAKQSKKVKLKGFRPGKTPITVVKRLYGRSIMADMVNETISKSMNDYIESEKLDLLGRPMPVKNHDPIDLDPDNIKEVDFAFNVAIAPKIELKGIDSSNKVKKYVIKPTPEMVEKEIEQVRASNAQSRDLTAEESLVETDVIKITAKELEGDQIKENGWETEFTLSLDFVDDEAQKLEILSKKIGDKFRFNIQTLEKNSNPEHVRKYLLIQDADDATVIGDHFEGQIESVNRREPADLDQDFYDRSFGPDVIHSEEELKDFLSKDLEKFFEKRADGLLFRDIQRSLLDLNPVQLPDDFLKRYLDEEEHRHGMGEEEYQEFATSLRWSLIRSELVKQFEVQVTQNEIRNYLLNKVYQQMNMYQLDVAVFEKYVDQNMMKDQKQVSDAYEEIMADKVFYAVKNVISFEEETITKEEMDEQYKAAREENEAKREVQEAIDKEREANHHHHHQHDHNHDHHDH
ncbi:MAG: trigger factor [Saprospiraceae bacterium]